MFRKKKKKSIETGSGFYIENDELDEDPTIERGSGAYFEGYLPDQIDIAGRPSGYEISENDTKEKEE